MNTNVTKEPKYNLRFVLKETGIKPDTLRAWERRYQLPTPERTEGGHRLFSDYDIEIIKWLQTKQKEGMSISRAVDLFRELESKGQSPIPNSTLFSSITHDSSTTRNDHEILADLKGAWLNACMNFDESSAEQVLNQAFAQFSPEIVCTEILQSGLSDIGTLWYQGKASVQQEHFTSELANRRLHSLINAAPQPIRNQTILVGCPNGETHTFGLLLLTLLLRYRSWNVVYLGASVPIEEMQHTINQVQPDLIVLTAMRIVTAATLLDTANLLHKNNVPLAFGGGIFNHLPSLRNRIPGHFLGEDIQDAVGNIEHLLSKPISTPNAVDRNTSCLEAKNEFIENKQQIEIKVLELILEEREKDISINDLNFALEFLSQDIIAALSIGNLDCIGTNLDWMKVLMQHRGISDNLFDEFLSAYLKAVRSILMGKGQPIITWLENEVRRSVKL